MRLKRNHFGRERERRILRYCTIRPTTNMMPRKMRIRSHQEMSNDAATHAAEHIKSARRNALLWLVIFALRTPVRYSSAIFPTGYVFSQRLFAALAAIWERFLGANFAALSTPPLSPPSRPSATAWGFFSGSAGFFAAGSKAGASPMDSRNIWCASSLGSRGRFLERSSMTPSVWAGEGPKSIS